MDEMDLDETSVSDATTVLAPSPTVHGPPDGETYRTVTLVATGPGPGDTASGQDSGPGASATAPGLVAPGAG